MESLEGSNGIYQHDEWWFALSYVGRLIGYIVILGLLVVIVSLVLKYLDECLGNGSSEDTLNNRESSPLWPEKAVAASYGTYQFDDPESGDCSASSSVELYDGKVCIICYDEERNCFFVPCGHCATCIACAKRIFDGESKTCPVCRRYIGKIKKLFAQ
uniref:RING-type domain-containing protein n=1 Tax=Kalanchoe fedtschenkoi TaxID=63787 RepID=A0A7N0ZXG2_KALFE